MAMEWTDELIARLKELWGQGLSTAEIGRQLSITKNAVVGKAHRLGLPPRPSPIRNKAAAEAASKPSRPRAARTKKTVTTGDKAGVEAAEAPPARKAGKKTGAKAAAPVAEAAEKPEKAGPAGEKQAAPVAEEAPAKPASRKDSREAAVPSGQTAAMASQEAARPAAPPRKVAPPRRVREAMDRPARQGPTCQWPIGDPGTPDFHFCGASALPGKPYCAEHAAVAYVKIRDRRH